MCIGEPTEHVLGCQWFLTLALFEFIYQFTSNYPCHDTIHIQHDCLSQMNSNFMINVSKLTCYHSLLCSVKSSLWLQWVIVICYIMLFIKQMWLLLLIYYVCILLNCLFSFRLKFAGWVISTTEFLSYCLIWERNHKGPLVPCLKHSSLSQLPIIIETKLSTFETFITCCLGSFQNDNFQCSQL